VSHVGLEPGSATHLLISGQDVRTNRELMEHTDAKTTIIYAYALNHRVAGIKSPTDILFS